MSLATIPTELHHLIAGYLDTDRDVNNYRLICRSTRNAIDEPKCYFWRDRFLRTFDPEQGKTAKELKTLYQKRRKLLRRGAHFKTGNGKKETAVLPVIRDLINNSHAGGGTDGASPSLNYQILTTFARDQTLLSNVCRFFKKIDRTTKKQMRDAPLLQAIQIVFSHLSLSLDPVPFPTFGFEESQQAVYANYTEAPMFGGFNGLEINVAWVLHCVNFFKYHLTRAEEQTMFEAYDGLHRDEHPQGWPERLREGSHVLGRHWKGTYAYLERHEMMHIRTVKPTQQIYPDMNINGGDKALQTLTLDFPPSDVAANMPWPRVFERHLNSLPTGHKQPKTRIQHRKGMPPPPAEAENVRFQGAGWDDEQYYSAGYLNPLPPQEGIPGWQRMTMMKYFITPNGAFDADALWAYEGVVLPGGQIIVGRWWSPEEDSSDLYSGPFIFWNVDKAVALEDGDEGEGEEMDTSGVIDMLPRA
ncbi:hypothetical protein LTS18_007965 [Coniosporium uncinatum]|uniref:Uncharacterized protein n=1 Tax=Coniosporium uncinatum TaxID=93489 RepID=A0ACC3DXK6_9PEZI|nr:hypothetical protein LTS18_007965 [Coniosporium uncinatum]